MQPTVLVAMQSVSQTADHQLITLKHLFELIGEPVWAMLS